MFGHKNTSTVNPGACTLLWFFLKAEFVTSIGSSSVNMFIEIGFASDNKMRVHSIFIKITQLNYTNTPLNHTAISLALMAAPLYNIDNSYLLCVCAGVFIYYIFYDVSTLGQFENRLFISSTCQGPRATHSHDCSHSSCQLISTSHKTCIVMRVLKLCKFASISLSCFLKCRKMTPNVLCVVKYKPMFYSLSGGLCYKINDETFKSLCRDIVAFCGADKAFTNRSR